MHRLITAISLLLLTICPCVGNSDSAAAVAETELPVFPGAEGFGTRTPAGRGGNILIVSNLNDSGPGSLREAINTSGPRIIVFEVGGSIRLVSDLIVREPFLTLAGQSSPSPGITLIGAGLSVQTHNVLVQHLRVRVGDLDPGPPPSARDAVNIIGPDAHNVVIDHVSASWAIDENVSTWGGVNNVTISNCLISEGLSWSRHESGPHSKGLLIGDGTRNVTISGNLFAHNADRNPLIKGGSSAVIVNNLMYNPGLDKFVELVDDYSAGHITASIVGNVFISGPDTPAHAALCKIHRTTSPGTGVYMLDNIYAGQKVRNLATFDPQLAAPPVWDGRLGPLSSMEVETRTIGRAGARPIDRDQVDLRTVAEVQMRNGRIINSQQEVGAWPVQPAVVRPFILPADPHGDPDGNGYSRIEEILHWMATALQGE